MLWKRRFWTEVFGLRFLDCGFWTETGASRDQKKAPLTARGAFFLGQARSLKPHRGLHLIENRLQRVRVVLSGFDGLLEKALLQGIDLV